MQPLLSASGWHGLTVMEERNDSTDFCSSNFPGDVHSDHHRSMGKTYCYAGMCAPYIDSVSYTHLELKWDKNAEGAIQQIKEKEYCRSLEEYKGNLLLVGINYDKKTQVHTCKIEQYRKEESI